MAAVLLACIPVGAGVMCWLDAGEAVAQGGLIVVSSFALIGLAGSAAIWLSAWSPTRWLIGLVAVSTFSCVVRLGTGTRR